MSGLTGVSSILIRKAKQHNTPVTRAASAALIFAVIGVMVIQFSGAATFAANGEAENGVVGGLACAVGDATASGSSSVRFGQSSCGNGAVVPGRNNLICDKQAQFLTSPWTYHALSSGQQQYTVAQYKALSGYGATLPPLPDYIANQASSTPAAVIYAPGATVDQPAYDFPETPMLYFYEGGNYGGLGRQSISGDMFIGGSAPGFPLPVFDSAGGAGGIASANDSYGPGNGAPPIATLTAAAPAGTTSITLTSSRIPVVKWATVVVDGHSYRVNSVTGSQSGYTLGIDGIDVGVVAGTSVYLDAPAGGVTVSYLDIAHDEHNTTGTIFTGSGWTVSHNKIHDGYSVPGQGVALYGGDESTIEYNCFSRMGNYAANIFGHNSIFRANEVFETNFKPDPGCGCSGGGKWWGTLNADIVDNAFVRSSPAAGGPIWLDNGNTGTNISGNFFDKTFGEAVSAETGHNLNVTNNLFQNGGWGNGTGDCGSNCNNAIGLNHTGGLDVPGSRYNNQVIIANNYFINNWSDIGIWQSGSRSCENSGEDWPYDASYCSGGYPVTLEPSAGGKYYFSHTGDSRYSGTTPVDQAAAAGSTTVLVKGAAAINDYIGFTGDPATTTTTSTTNVSSLSGSGTVAAASTASFPSSGQIRVGTSEAWGDAGGSYTGAILSYTGKTATSFTGVARVRGAGTLAGPVRAVEPYKITAQTCYANDCRLTITPALSSAVAAGTEATNAGTCSIYAVPGASATSPLAPNGISYWEGCQWGTKNVSINNNTFVFDPAAINAGKTINGASVTCNSSNDCGVEFQAFQLSGEPPFSGGEGANAMMSRSGLTGCPSWDSGCTTNPLANINALANPPNASPNNGTPPGNINWSNNKYSGTVTWELYDYGGCNDLPTDSQTGKSMPSDACRVTFPKWQSYWMQETGSTYSATPVYPTF